LTKREAIALHRDAGPRATQAPRGAPLFDEPADPLALFQRAFQRAYDGYTGDRAPLLAFLKGCIAAIEEADLADDDEDNDEEGGRS
jgi:hypothetical protein